MKTNSKWMRRLVRSAVIALGLELLLVPARGQVAQTNPTPSEESKALNNLVISGYMYTQYEDFQGADGSFALGSFNPIFLYRQSERVLAEVELELEVDDTGETTTELEYAQIDWLLNDHMTLIAGRFILPLGVFNEKLHPQWINKLPTSPLPYSGGGGHHDSILPFNDIGVQLRGACGGGGGPVYSYAAYVVNGPGFEEGPDEHAEAEGGLEANGQVDEAESEISFESGRDTNGDPSFGGRVAAMHPWGEYRDVEVGVSAQGGTWDQSETLDWIGLVVDGTLHAGPYFELRGEYIWTEQETDHDTLNPVGAWVQPAFKLAGCNLDWPFINNTEAVFRWSYVDRDGDSKDAQRYGFGLLYYITNTLQLKGAYEVADSDDSGLDSDSIVAQLAFGF